MGTIYTINDKKFVIFIKKKTHFLKRNGRDWKGFRYKKKRKIVSVARRTTNYLKSVQNYLFVKLFKFQ